MMYYNDFIYQIDNNSDGLCHSGTKGQKWGRRLYQYKDGSLTPLGRLRYLKGVKVDLNEADKNKKMQDVNERLKKSTTSLKLQNGKMAKKQQEEAKKQQEEAKKQLSLDKINRNKEKAMATLNTNYVSEHINLFTTDELTAYSKRLEAVNNIKKNNKAVSSTETSAKIIENLNKIAKEGIDAYNNYNTISSFFKEKK